MESSPLLVMSRVAQSADMDVFLLVATEDRVFPSWVTDNPYLNEMLLIFFIHTYGPSSAKFRLGLPPTVVWTISASVISESDEPLNLVNPS